MTLSQGEHAAPVVPPAGGHDRQRARGQPVRRRRPGRHPPTPRRGGRRRPLRAPPHGHADLPPEFRSWRRLCAHLHHRQCSHQQVTK